MNLNNIPNDQYSCTECNLVPEILTVNYEKEIIKFNCPNHKEKEMNLKEYFNREMTYLCNNCGKYFTQIKEKSILNNIFNYCVTCKKHLCQKCSKNHEHKSSFIKISESKIKCHTHQKNFFCKYCQKCKTHFCKEDKIICNDAIEDIEKAKEIQINIIKNKRDNLIQQLEHFQRLVKLLDTLLKTYEKYPSNYFHYLNIVNTALDIEEENERERENDDDNRKKNEKINKKIQESENGVNVNEDQNNNIKKIKKINIIKKDINEKEKININKDINKKEKEITSNHNDNNNKINENKGNNNYPKNIVKNNINKKEEKFTLKADNEINQNKNDNKKNIEKQKINKNIEEIYTNSNNNNKDLNNNEIKVEIFQNNNIKIKEDEKKEKLLSKINNLERKIETSKFNIEIKLEGDEFIIDLNGRNIDNIKLIDILVNKEFKNLTELILRNNNLTEIDNTLVYLNAPNLKKLDLSHNKIWNIAPSKELVLNHKNLNHIDLRHNFISNANIFKDKVFVKKEILLDENNILKKDLEEIKNILMKKEFENIGTIIYNLDKTKDKIRIFGKGFVSKYKKICKIIINKKEIEVTEFYSYNKKAIKNDDNLTLEIKIKINQDVTSFYSLFKECSNLVSLSDISEWDTSEITDMTYMFCGCTSLSSISDISKWNTSKVTDMTNMFSECKLLKELPDISMWDVSSVNDMSFMFSKCEELENLPDINKWNVSSVKNMNSMFYGCKKLTIFPNGNKEQYIWNTGNVNNMSCMFFQCGNLSDIGEMDKWNISKVINKENMFTGCRLIKKKIPKKFLI